MLKRMQNRLKRTFQVLTTGTLSQEDKRVIPAITMEEVAEAKEFFPMPKFFIFGHARSGTTLLTRLIRLHDQVHCNYQGHFFTRHPLVSGMASDKSFHSWFAR
ncbi:MAG: sulfotransferase, partial [Chloroflexota bacterium]